MIDGYQHVGLPRFQSAATALQIMDLAGIERAIICPFDTCPDLLEVHRAKLIAPTRFLIFGLALGNDRAEIEAGLRAQFAAGFEGMRLTPERVAAFPTILDVIGQQGGIALVAGSRPALHPASRELLTFLEQYKNSLLLCPHFAGPDDSEAFERNDTLSRLYGHPRFLVVLSRQSLFDKAVLHAWTNALVKIVGWDRLLWGSEAPVLHWREETFEEAYRWIDRFSPSEMQRSAYLHGNAERLLFARPKREVAPLLLPYSPMNLVENQKAPVFPFGFNCDTRIPGLLLSLWVESGMRLSLSDFASDKLLAALSVTRRDGDRDVQE